MTPTDIRLFGKYLVDTCAGPNILFEIEAKHICFDVVIKEEHFKNEKNNFY